jgi:putative ABC transport system permease protein
MMVPLPRMPLALRILLHTPGRLAVSIAGILLAIVLMFSQSGFRNGMFDSQTELIRRIKGDLMIVGRLKVLMYVGEPFPSRRIYQAQACPGVQAVYPLYTESDTIWHNLSDGTTRPVRVLAFNPDDPVFDLPGVSAHAAALKMPDTVLFDELARDYYGQPRPRAGTEAELNGRKVTVVGTFRLGTDFVTDGNLIMSDHNFLRFFPDCLSPAPRLDKVMVGVVRVAPRADLRAVQRTLQEALPEDVAVLTKQELVELETTYWRNSTAIGFIFTLGMTVGFLVGILICYQVLYSNVSNYLPQFATLKAMGFTDRFLVGVVLQQGVLLALMAFLPAVGVAQVLFWVVSDWTGLLLFLTPSRIACVLLLAVAMCMVSGAIAVRRVLAADPAEMFR